MAISSLPFFATFDYIADGQAASYIVGPGFFDSVSGSNMKITTADGIRRLRCGPQSGSPNARMAIPAVTDIVLGFLARFNSGGIGTPDVVFYSGGTKELGLDMNSSGDLILRRGGTAIDSDSTQNYNDGVSRYIELAYKVHQTEGVYEVRVDGETVMSGTGVDTTVSGNAIDQFRMEGGNTFASGEYVEATYIYLKEWDSASTPGFLGTLQAVEGIPSADIS